MPLLTNTLLPLKNSIDEFTWFHGDLDKVLNYFIEISPFYKDLMAWTLITHGALLTLAVYYDELTPGDAFAADNQRKI